MRKLEKSVAVALGAAVLCSPALAQDTITLGAAVSLTGKYVTSGEHTQRGYDLTVQEINKAGGIKVGGKTYMLKVKYYDDESTPTRGAQLAERLIQQDGIKFLLGPYSSGMTKAIAPITEKFKIPMVEGNGASRSLFTNGWKYIFATLSTSEQYLAGATKLAAENVKALGKKKASDITVAMAFENDPFSQDVRAGVLADTKKFGMKVVIDDQLPRDLNDMTATLTKVKALKPDILIVSGHAKGATTAIRQIDQMHVSVPILAMTHCDAAAVIKKFGKASNGTMCATQWAPTMSYKGKVFGTAGEFAALFKKTYGYVPPYQAAESAAAVLAFVDAFKRAGSLEPEAVRKALAKTDLMTFYGPIKFDETGKNPAKPMALYQVIDQKYRIVYPSGAAETKAIIPQKKEASR
jgi:branched-chain amino acid transport system substrate-binding protein